MTQATVTGIVPDPRKPGRFAVQVDGRETATLSIDAIERLRLATGAIVDDRCAAEIEREAGVLATYDRALNMLAARARAVAELRRLLIRKGEPAHQVDPAIDRLCALGFLDDAKFARQFTRSKVAGSGLSRRRVQQELSRRGVARDVLEPAIAEVFAEENVDEATALMRVAEKKHRTLATLDADTQRRRLYGFLARRGYSPDEVASVVRELVGKDADES